MTLLIYRDKPSEGAVAVAAALREMGIEAKKVSRIPRRHPERHKYVNWGSVGAEGLNNSPLYGKLTEIQKLTAAGIPTVTVGNRGEGYIYRNFTHQGGLDLLFPEEAARRPGFWVKKEEISHEYRVHVFRGASIRAGRKGPANDYDAHDWVRSYGGGWRIYYDGTGVKNRHRDIAKTAVEALGLDFAAVDVAERPDRSVFVLEVNRAPGAEGRTAIAYAEKIKAWLEE